MANLKEQAEALGIEVDNRWSEATLKAKIKEARDAKKDGGDAGHTGADVGGPSPAAAAGAPVADDGTQMTTEPTPKAVKSGVVLDEKTLLQAKAIELHVEVDPDWDETRLRAEIQMAREGRADLQVKGAVPGPDMGDANFDPATRQDKIVDGVEVTLKRDYWRGPDDRVAKGSTITVARTKARELLANDVIETPGF